jgi:hypothetical protein
MALLPSYGSNLAHLNARSFLTLDDPSAEADGARVQAFYAAMEAAFREHPLWANATHQEIDHALEVSTFPAELGDVSRRIALN